jgi:hypothetical protein
MDRNPPSDAIAEIAGPKSGPVVAAIAISRIAVAAVAISRVSVAVVSSPWSYRLPTRPHPRTGPGLRLARARSRRAGFRSEGIAPALGARTTRAPAPPSATPRQRMALRPKWSCNKWLLAMRGIFWLVQRRSKTVLLTRNEKESPPPARTCWSRHGFGGAFSVVRE